MSKNCNIGFIYVLHGKRPNNHGLIICMLGENVFPICYKIGNKMAVICLQPVIKPIVGFTSVLNY